MISDVWRAGSPSQTPKLLSVSTVQVVIHYKNSSIASAA